MKVGVTGATSEIGKATLASLEDLGISGVRLVRSPRYPSDRRFDLHQNVDDRLVDGLSGVIHLAWDWRDGAGANARGTSALIDACRRQGLNQVLASTISTLGAPESKYGTDKMQLEGKITAAGGTSFRAGLIWGTIPSGIISTVIRLSRLPGLCPHVVPDPMIWHTEVSRLANLLALSVSGSQPKAAVAIAAYWNPVSLSDIQHAVQERQVRLHVNFPLAPITRGINQANRIGLPLHQRTDSLMGIRQIVSDRVRLSSDPWIDDFPGTSQFIEWLHRIRDMVI